MAPRDIQVGNQNSFIYCVCAFKRYLKSFYQKGNEMPLTIRQRIITGYYEGLRQ